MSGILKFENGVTLDELMNALNPMRIVDIAYWSVIGEFHSDRDGHMICDHCAATSQKRLCHAIGVDRI